ncbi:hypothetical protein OQA88_5278 [Cercophora sp. LCS_1]
MDPYEMALHQPRHIDEPSPLDCYCCISPTYNDPLETTPAFSTRYLTGRPSTADPNPRGKHHRKPLPWSRSKLSKADGYAWDLDEYRKYTWQQKKDGKPIPKKVATPHFITLVEAHRKRHRVVGYRCSCCYEVYRERMMEMRKKDPGGLMKEGMRLVREGAWIPGEGRRPEWRRGVRTAHARVVKEVVLTREADGDADGYEREEGFSLGQIPVEEGYRVTWRPARRRRRVVESEAGSDSETEEESVRCEEWEWEFVAAGRIAKDDDLCSAISSEWVGVAEDVDSAWDGSQGDWEICR